MTFQYLVMKIEELENRINALEQETCKDAISVPEKVGKWMMPDEGFNVNIWRKCSYCKKHIEAFSKYTDFSGTVHYIPRRLNYCPLCGVEMVKREDKE